MKLEQSRELPGEPYDGLCLIFERFHKNRNCPKAADQDDRAAWAVPYRGSSMRGGWTGNAHVVLCHSPRFGWNGNRHVFPFLCLELVLKYVGTIRWFQPQARKYRSN